MRATQEDAEGEEEDAAEGAAAADQDLSSLVRILPDRSSVTEGNLYRLVFAKEMK